MIGIRENDFRAQFFQRALRQSLDGRRRPHRHEKWSLDSPMRRSQSPPSRPSRISFAYLKRKTHTASLSGLPDGTDSPSALTPSQLVQPVERRLAAPEPRFVLDRAVEMLSRKDKRHSHP